MQEALVRVLLIVQTPSDVKLLGRDLDQDFGACYFKLRTNVVLAASFSSCLWFLASCRRQQVLCHHWSRIILVFALFSHQRQVSTTTAAMLDQARRTFLALILLYPTCLARPLSSLSIITTHYHVCAVIKLPNDYEVITFGLEIT